MSCTRKHQYTTSAPLRTKFVGKPCGGATNGPGTRRVRTGNGSANSTRPAMSFVVGVATNAPDNRNQYTWQQRKENGCIT